MEKKYKLEVVEDAAGLGLVKGFKCAGVGCDIRNKNDYAYSNIYFYINTIYSNGEVAVDTNIEFQLAMPDGQWLGKQSGGYVDGRYPLGYIRFPEKGKYQFVIKHAMRDTALAGIKDVGMHIEKM